MNSRATEQNPERFAASNEADVAEPAMAAEAAANPTNAASNNPPAKAKPTSQEEAASSILRQHENLNASEETRRTLYAEFASNDPRFDGEVFVGVSSTGIYCRTVCKARMPKFENCTFYRTPAEAEAAGFRPCMKCRPETAPGMSQVDAYSNLARRAAMLLRENCSSGIGLEALSTKLGYTSRHLRRVFMEEFGVTPVQYLQTCRLLLAKSLLTDSDLPVSQVAYASGFGSVRRMNDLFKNNYHITPTDLRKRRTIHDIATDSASDVVPNAEPKAGSGPAAGSPTANTSTASTHKASTINGTIKMRLGYRPPYRFEDLLGFFSARILEGIEFVDAKSYSRTVMLEDFDGNPVAGWLRVENDPAHNSIRLTMSDSLIPVLPQVIARVKRQFDLDSDPQAIAAGLAPLDELLRSRGNNIGAGEDSGNNGSDEDGDLHSDTEKKDRSDSSCEGNGPQGVRGVKPGTRLPGCFDPFETTCRAILGQQISVKAANKLAARIAETYGARVETGIEGLDYAWPTPEFVASLDGIEAAFGVLGVIKTRSRVIAQIARGMLDGTLSLESSSNAEEQMKNLLALKGIGPWSANYIAMRVMSYPDAFLESDAGVAHALPEFSVKERKAMSENWRPWRSYAVVNLWNSLSE